ncbi:MAG: metallophosphoesterase [Roseiflexaceae bacterium]
MRIITVDERPFHELPYRTVAPGGGGVMRARLPILRGLVDTLPPDIDAIFAASDLQGVADQRGDGEAAPRLMGEVLAEELAHMAALGFFPPLQRMAVLLCGDMYVRPELDSRGGMGDVRSVWRAFARHFRWVAGVPGNHDSFGSDPLERAAFAAERNIHVLDNDLIRRDGLKIGGMGGVIGNKMMPGRHGFTFFTRGVQSLLQATPDILLLHQGPDAPTYRLPGDARVRLLLEEAKPTLVMCGHVHWHRPLAFLSNDTQVLNLEARGVLLQKAEQDD